MVRAWLLCFHPHPCSHLALISGSLGREPRFRIQENVPGSGHCAEPGLGSPSGNCYRREEGRECCDRIKDGGGWLLAPLWMVRQDPGCYYLNHLMQN